MVKKKVTKVADYVFKEGDIVAAKVKGHPIWPGRVESITPNGGKKFRYLVKFFGTNDMSNKFTEIKPFSALTSSELACKSRKFQEALDCCRSVLDDLEKNNFRKRQGRSKKNVEFDEEPAVLTIALSPNEDSSQDDEPEEDKAELDEKQQAGEEETPQPISMDGQSSQNQQEGHDHDTNPVLQEEPITDIREPEPNDLLDQGVGKKPEDKIEASKQVETCRASEEKDLEAENITHVETNGTSYLLETPNTPNDPSECPPPPPPPPSEPKASAGSPRDCSLNDLTSKKANADRGRRKTPIKLQPKAIQETKKELTIAKLKKKIDLKLEEKANLKRAIMERKSFEKASKILPKFTLMFDPLAMSSQQLLKRNSNKMATNQFTTSIKNCEKHLDLLDKCLKVMISDYGKRQKESFLFQARLVDIVTDLKKLKGRPKSDPGSREASHLLKLLKKHKTIKEFINSDEIPNSSSESVAERKENSTKHDRSTR